MASAIAQAATLDKRKGCIFMFLGAAGYPTSRVGRMMPILERIRKPRIVNDFSFPQTELVR